MAPQPTIAFGPDYPASLLDLIDGVPMPLVREQRWARTFRHPTTGAMFWIPRFMDGSATMTLAELHRSWPTWTADERRAFSASAPWLHEQSDFADILRFLMREGDARVWCSIALAVASQLPQEEAFRVLCEALDAMAPSASSNILQAIARTGHVSARLVIKRQVDRLCAAPELWADDNGLNRLASTAIYGIKYLLKLGEDPATLTSIVQSLSEHHSDAVRRECDRQLQSRQT